MTTFIKKQTSTRIVRNTGIFIMIDLKKRTIAKTISWKLIGIFVLIVAAWSLTGNLIVVSAFALGYHLIQSVLYLIHERLWNKVGWGKSKGLFVQMTGMSGAGKTTIAKALQTILQKKGLLVEVIDGDEYREGLCKDLGFSKSDRNTNIRRLGFVGKILSRNNVITMLSAINPYDEVRQELTQLGENVKTVFVKCDLDRLIERDTKGLYKKAISGEILNFTGISDPFEEPKQPDLILDTNKETVEQSVKKLEKFILEQV